MKIFFATILFSLVSFSCFAQKHQRWDVKTLSDGFTPNLSHPKKVTVASMGAIVRNKGVKNNQPRLNFEKKVIRITGTITRIQLEKGTAVKPGDMDYHIEVSDGTLGDSTLVCESVDPADDAVPNSTEKDSIQKVRNVVKNLKKGDKVTFTGIEFEDKIHSPSPHRTRNFIEMHPILYAKKL
jgi:hypothetical protein